MPYSLKLFFYINKYQLLLVVIPMIWDRPHLIIPNPRAPRTLNPVEIKDIGRNLPLVMTFLHTSWIMTPLLIMRSCNLLMLHFGEKPVIVKFNLC